MKPAAFSESNPVPRHWEKRVLTAYLRMMGMTQKQAGAAVGRSERTIRDWEADTAIGHRPGTKRGTAGWGN
jgi:hypothetical protein